VHLIPRIHFKFQPPFAQSHQLIRLQFPFRLAYAVSTIKAYGQELQQYFVTSSYHLSALGMRILE